MDRLAVMLEVNKVRLYMYWYGMTLMEKLKWLAVLITAISGYVFWVCKAGNGLNQVFLSNY